MIPVTRTFLPPISEYTTILQQSWDKKWITNRGGLVNELESVLRKYLGVENIILMNNGTVPIQIALKLLGKQGEIITTPFSYVATTSSIIWESCRPVFVDIHPEYFTIDESKIEAAITKDTTAILATHVFGNPCDIDAIMSIAQKHGLKVIFDAAHCFGVKYKGKSVFSYGDVSTCSFHATKIFHTGEGGASFCNDPELNHQLFYSHNFGHNGPLDFYGLGINGKISELHAALGLAVLPYMDKIFSGRKRVVNTYINLLKDTPLTFMRIRENTDWNFSYFPVVFPSEQILIQCLDRLKDQNIFPRRYFYPSLDRLPYLSSPYMQISNDVASRIICLPLYPDLGESDVVKISGIISQQF